MKVIKQNPNQPKKLTKAEQEKKEQGINHIKELIEKVDNYSKKLYTDFNEKLFELGDKKLLEKLDVFLRNYANWSYQEVFYLDKVLNLLDEYIKNTKDGEKVSVKFILPESVNYFMAKVNGTGDYLVSNNKNSKDFSRQDFIEIYTAISEIFKNTVDERSEISFVTYNETDRNDQQKYTLATQNLAKQYPTNIAIALRIILESYEKDYLEISVDDFLNDVINEAKAKGIINSEWKLPE